MRFSSGVSGRAVKGACVSIGEVSAPRSAALPEASATRGDGGAVAGDSPLAMVVPGTTGALAPLGILPMNSPNASCTSCAADCSACSLPRSSASNGSCDFTGYRSNTSRCWYAATGASMNCCGATACFRSSTRRTTRGWFWPTRTPAMNGSSERTLPTRSRSAGLSSRLSMSTTRRFGLSARKLRACSGWSDSIVTRV